MNATKNLIQKYYDSFNKQDVEGMLECLHAEVVHDINEGPSEMGVNAFRNFLLRMNKHYKENLENIVIMTDEQGLNASAKFIVQGAYLQTDPGLPEARGQKYSLPAVGVFEIQDRKIKRMTNYYNLKKWIELVK